MNKNVIIKQAKSGKCKVIDVKTNKPWANEIFDDYEEAKEFCDDNKLKLQQTCFKKVVEYKTQQSDCNFEDDGRIMNVEVLSGLENFAAELFIISLKSGSILGHKELKQFVNRKVRITIETID